MMIKKTKRIAAEFPGLKTLSFRRSGNRESAPEEIAFINGFIGKEKLLESAAAYGKSPYGERLRAVAEGNTKY